MFFQVLEIRHDIALVVNVFKKVVVFKWLIEKLYNLQVITKNKNKVMASSESRL